jgi:tRNA-Thr(GGU) m(6)t(6)A37 methyltransferase TsaA
MARKRTVTKPDAIGGRERLDPIGIIHSTLKMRSEAPKQGREGAPDAWLEVRPSLVEGLDGISVGDEIVVVTWLHQARRDVLKVHPRDNTRLPLTGVFATRSQDRPNPLGLHPVIVKRIAGNRLRIGPIEAIDRTPVIDIKPALGRLRATSPPRPRSSALDL